MRHFRVLHSLWSLHQFFFSTFSKILYTCINSCTVTASVSNYAPSARPALATLVSSWTEFQNLAYLIATSQNVRSLSMKQVYRGSSSSCSSIIINEINPLDISRKDQFHGWFVCYGDLAGFEDHVVQVFTML